MTIARRSALPATLAPRLIGREAAAVYVCVSPNTFDQMVDDGRMPPPKRLGPRRFAWDVRELDSAVDQLPTEGADSKNSDDDTWGDVNAS